MVLADTAYDASYLRQAIAAKNSVAVIPNNPSRSLKYPLDKHLYAPRHLVECLLLQLKQFRQVRNPHRENRPQLPRRCHSRGYCPMVAVTVHTA